MVKLTSVLLFVVLFSIVPLHAQRLPDLPKPQVVSKTDLKKVFAKETQKLKAESATVDKKQMGKLLMQTSKNKWSGKQTALVILIAVGIAALVFVLIKYGKECLRYEDNCDPAFDQNCYCEEYAPRNRETSLRR